MILFACILSYSFVFVIIFVLGVLLLSVLMCIHVIEKKSATLYVFQFFCFWNQRTTWCKLSCCKPETRLIKTDVVAWFPWVLNQWSIYIVNTTITKEKCLKREVNHPSGIYYIRFLKFRLPYIYVSLQTSYWILRIVSIFHLIITEKSQQLFLYLYYFIIIINHHFIYIIVNSIQRILGSMSIIQFCDFLDLFVCLLPWFLDNIKEERVGETINVAFHTKNTRK